MRRGWKIKEADDEQVMRIRRELDCSPIIARLLVIRNLVERGELDYFLNPRFSMLQPPEVMAGISQAAARISKALSNNERILIFSDFDVDGITSAILLLDFLGALQAEVEYYIPHRVKEGYGLKTIHIREVAQKKKIDLIITADCGSSSHEAVDAANQAGIDVIITDHHQIPEPLPSAHAIVNPHRRDCSSGMTYLAGVGVVFYLLIQLRKDLRESGFWQGRQQPNLKKYCDLVTLGTVADVVPLIRENRIFAKAGVELIQAEERLSITTLMRQCKLDAAVLDADDIAFRICPRINAAGRLSHADAAVELFRTDDPQVAERQSQYLDQINTARRETVTAIYDQVLIYLNAQPYLDEKKIIILAHHGWHIGVLGIVAARLVERFYRPVVLISINDGVGIGSARSIEGFDLYQGLAACAPHLERFGGHKMAAGLKIKQENIHQFIIDFEKVAGNRLREEYFIKTLDIDMELSFDVLSHNLLLELRLLQPFGNGNPEPLFLSKNVSVHFSRIIGKGHRRLVLFQPDSKLKNKIQAIHFNVGEANLNQTQFAEIVYRIRPNHYNGSNSFQLLIEACR